MTRSRLTVAALGFLGAVLLLPSPARAQFGRNKVQYRPRTFEIIRTDHFDLYYYDEEREAADPSSSRSSSTSG